MAHDDLLLKELGDDSRRQEISIPARELCEFLNRAERWFERQKSGTLSKPTVIPGLKKRKRSPTPAEEMRPDNEVRFVEREEKVRRRVSREDPDWEGSKSNTSSE